MATERVERRLAAILALDKHVAEIDADAQLDAVVRPDARIEAREALEKAMAIVPGSFDMYVRGRVPWMRPEDHAHMLEGLRQAGWEG